MEFHETKMGSQFYNRQLPKLIGALERIADAIEKQNMLLENNSKSANTDPAPGDNEPEENDLEDDLLDDKKTGLINDFRGEYYFLSNFYSAPVMYEGVWYKNNEAAFQSAKIADKKERVRFAQMDPSAAKRAGRHVKLRDDWEDIKSQVMYDIVLDKFTRNPNLRIRLLETGERELQEGNTWGDRIWGTVGGIGENRLGKILMEVREKLSMIS